MRRKNDTLAAKINRMMEFYDGFDLDTFDDFIEQKEIPVEKAWTFLDMQTRADYFAINGRTNPIIYDYMQKLVNHYGSKK